MRRYDHAPECLRKLLNERAWDTQELAKRTGIDAATLREYLSGRRISISTRNMLVLATAFEIPMSQLIDDFTNGCQNTQ